MSEATTPPAAQPAPTPAAQPTAPTPTPEIPAEILAKLTEWAKALGRPTEELVQIFKGYKLEFTTNIPGKTAEWYNEKARRKTYLSIKSALRSPAKPYDWISLGLSGAVDVTAADREERKALYNNEQTRAQAIAEGKVLGVDTTFGNTLYPAGTPLDNKEWMIAPDPTKGVEGRKNRNWKKPLLPRFIRTLVGFGTPVASREFKLFSIMTNADKSEKLPIPPIKASLRSRVNLRFNQVHHYQCNQSTQMKFDPVQIPEFPEITDAVICNILRTAPVALRPNLTTLMQWHKENKDDKRRLAIIEADVTWINRVPTDYGSYMMVLEDESQEDLKTEGTPCWVPPELKPILDTFGANSKVFTIVRTNIGPGYDRETRQTLPDVQRVNCNACAIFVVPGFREAPEEEAVVMPEAVPVAA